MTTIPNLRTKFGDTIYDLNGTELTEADIFGRFKEKYPADVQLLRQRYDCLISMFSVKAYFALALSQYAKEGNSLLEATSRTVPAAGWPGDYARIYRVRRPPPNATLVEISIGISAIAVAVAAFLPVATGMPRSYSMLFTVLSLLSGFIAVTSAFSSLWFLAQYCFGHQREHVGYSKITDLFASPGLGPHWLLSIGLLGWLVLSVFIAALAVMRLRTSL